MVEEIERGRRETGTWRVDAGIAGAKQVLDGGPPTKQAPEVLLV